MDIGKRIKYLRKDLKLTQAEFGKKIGLKPTAIGMYENGARSVSEQSIALIVNAFNVSEIWLRTGNGSAYLQTNSSILDNSSLDDTDREIISSYINMTPTQRQFLKDWIAHIADVYHKTKFTSDESNADWKEKELDNYKKELEAQEKGRSVSDITNEKRA